MRTLIGLYEAYQVLCILAPGISTENRMRFYHTKQVIAHLRKSLFFAFLSMWGEVEIFFVGEVIIASIDWAENTISTMIH